MPKGSQCKYSSIAVVNTENCLTNTARANAFCTRCEQLTLFAPATVLPVSLMITELTCHNTRDTVRRHAELTNLRKFCQITGYCDRCSIVAWSEAVAMDRPLTIVRMS